MALLLLLNLVIRIPSIPHEKGYDSFFIHSLANSISTFGVAEWWVNWLSVFGLYPYSYASAVPFTLSGMSQLTGIEMEIVILLFCVIIGLLGMFTAYIFAGIIYDNFVFKYIMALFFSIAPGIMVYTTWEVSTRGQFLILFPLFIYILLKNNGFLKKCILLVITFILLFATHHYAYFLVLIAIIYGITNILKKIKLPFFKESYYEYIFPLAILTLFLVPFFTRSLIDSGSRYGWIITALITNTRYNGPTILFLIGGVTYLLKKKKTPIEIMILSIMVLFIPTLYSHTYGPFLLILFIVFLISVGFNNVLQTLAKHKNKLLVFYVVFIVFSFVVFSSFYNHNRTGESESFWYMADETYTAGSWGKEYIPANSRGLDTGFETGRVFAISEGHPITPWIGAVNLAYGFISKNKIEYNKNSVFSKEYYFEGPYSVKGGTTTAGRIEWIRQYGGANDLKNFDYYVQDKYQYKPIFRVVELNSNQVYDNSRLAVWKI
jgi:hypothetical protein